MTLRELTDQITIENAYTIIDDTGNGMIGPVKHGDDFTKTHAKKYLDREISYMYCLNGSLHIELSQTN